MKKEYENRITYDKNGKVKTLSMSCTYLHLEKLEDGKWWLGIDRNNNDHLMSYLTTEKGEPIHCDVKIEEHKLQSYPFAEEKCTKK